MAVLDKFEKRVFMVIGSMIAIFIFSILYAVGRYKSNNVPECIPFDKAYTEPKVNKIDDKT